MATSRLKREDCSRTKHDSVFSNWKVLIGPYHWEEYSLGKDGVERYMTQNLPAACSCPGIYELGVAAIPNSQGLRSRKLTSVKIIVVYLGEADNVRTRLQHYGRAGSHLDHGSKIRSDGLRRGPGLFKEIFSRGYSIMFRWAPMTSKKEAERMESRLLAVFDYAWNMRENGSCRREDILFRLDNTVMSPVHAILEKLQRWKPKRFNKKVGIKISTSWPLSGHDSSNDEYGFRLPRIFKFGKSRPRLVPGDDICDTDFPICGVAMGDGSVCKKIPVDGRKRCIDHKGKKISATRSIPTRKTEVTEGNSSVCGVVTKDGSFCMELTNLGRKRCVLHRGRRITGAKHEPLEAKLLDLIETAIGKPCLQLVNEDINLEKESDIDVSLISSAISVSNLYEMHEEQNNAGTQLPIGKVNREVEGTQNLNNCNICGVVTADGNICTRVPLPGRKRCENHKGIKKTNRIDLLMSRKTSWIDLDSQPAVCVRV